MANKRRPPPLEEPPTASSSSSSDEEEQQPSSQPQEDEVEASSGEEEAEEASEEEDEEDQPPANSQTASKNPPSSPPINSHSKPSSSDSESGSEAESESDDVPSPTPPNPKVKPLASKPMGQNPKTKAQAQSSPAPSRSGTKRAVEDKTHVTDSKRAKKKTTDTAAVTSGGGSDDEMETEDDVKKSIDDSKVPFQRVFSEDDEITILKSLADFISKTGNDPEKYITAFYDYVKKSLQFDATSLQQLKQKVRRLKNKFKANAAKGKNGEDRTFPKPHEQKLFELSKKVWGNEFNKAVENGKANGKLPKSPTKESSRKKAASSGKKPLPETSEEPDTQVVVPLKQSVKVESDKVGGSSLILSEMLRFDNGVGLNGLNEDVARRAVEMMAESKRAELERRWKKLQVAELELFVKRAQLIEDQAKLILETYKSSGD